MPIEVRELIIRAKMNEADTGSGVPEEDLLARLEEQQAAMFREFKEQAVKECLQNVAKLLKKLKQR